jgi:CHASE2 domain-containing sensor protein
MNPELPNSGSSEARTTPTVQRVVVRDIQMSFGSMVVFMVKWAIAAIPALIILIVLGALVSAFAAGGDCVFHSQSLKRVSDPKVGDI